MFIAGISSQQKEKKSNCHILIEIENIKAKKESK